MHRVVLLAAAMITTKTMVDGTTAKVDARTTAATSTVIDDPWATGQTEGQTVVAVLLDRTAYLKGLAVAAVTAAAAGATTGEVIVADEADDLTTGVKTEAVNVARKRERDILQVIARRGRGGECNFFCTRHV